MTVLASVCYSVWVGKEVIGVLTPLDLPLINVPTLPCDWGPLISTLFIVAENAAQIGPRRSEILAKEGNENHRIIPKHRIGWKEVHAINPTITRLVRYFKCP